MITKPPSLLYSRRLAREMRSLLQVITLRAIHALVILSLILPNLVDRVQAATPVALSEDSGSAPVSAEIERADLVQSAAVNQALDFAPPVADRILASVPIQDVPESLHRPTTALNGSNSAVYLASRGQVGRSRNFYSASPHWENVKGVLPVPIGNRGGITEFVLDPFNSINRAWVSTGDPDAWTGGAVWRTDNLDSTSPTWTQVLSEAQIKTAMGSTGAYVKRMQASSLQAGLIFIAAAIPRGALNSELRIGRSLDYGATWTWSPALGQIGDRSVGLELSDHNASRLWTAVGNPGGKILVSNNMEATFTVLYDFSASSWWHPYDIHVPAANNPNDQIMFAMVDTSSTTTGLFRSLNGGATWTNVTDPATPGSVLSGNVKSYAGDNQRVFYAGGSWAFTYSTNGGSNWTQRYTNANTPMGSVWGWAYNPDRLLTARQSSATSTGTIAMYSANGGVTWTDKTGDWFTTIGSAYSGGPGTSGVTSSVTIVDAMVGSATLPPSQAFATNECPFCNNREKVYTAGQGVNAFSGNYNHQHSDGEVVGLGGALSFERSYNSLTTGVTGYLAYNDVLGYGWTHNYNVRLLFNPAGEPVNTTMLTAPRGSQLRFTDNLNGTYTPYPAVLAQMTRTGTSGNYTYTVTTNSQYKYNFNNSGRLTQITNPQNQIATLTYNASNQLTQVKDASNARWLNFAYLSGRISTVTDSTSRSATFTYSAGGDLTGVTDMSGRVWTYQYQGTAHWLTKVLLKNGATTTQTMVENVYDTVGRVTTQKDGAGNTIATVNYALADPAQRQVQDRGVTTTVTFDSGVPTTVDGPGNSDNQTAFTGLGINPGIVTDPLGNATTLQWSPDGNNLTKATDPLGNATNFTYDSLNNLKQVTDALQQTTVYTYTNSLLTSFSDALSNTTSYTYMTAADTGQPLNLLKSETDPLGAVTRYTYTAQGQVATVIRNYKDGNYDATKPDEDLKTTYTYDTAGRVLTITDNQTTQVKRFTYNTAGDLLTVTDNYLAGQAQNYLNLYNQITTYTYR